MDPRKDPTHAAKTIGTKPDVQVSKLEAGVKSLPMNKPVEKTETKKDPKYDLGRKLLANIEKAGAFKDLPQPGRVHHAPEIVAKETTGSSVGASTGDNPTPVASVKSGAKAPAPAESKPVKKDMSKAATDTTRKASGALKGTPADLENAPKKK